MTTHCWTADEININFREIRRKSSKLTEHEKTIMHVSLITDWYFEKNSVKN